MNTRASSSSSIQFFPSSKASLLFVQLLVLAAHPGNVHGLASPITNTLKLVANSQVDYSAAAEFIEEHYHIPNYFGGEGTVRSEPIFDARDSVVTKDGKIVAPLGAMHDCGFCLIDAPTEVENFEDLSQVQSTYLKEMAEWIPQALQIDKDEIESIIFWHPMLRGESITPQQRSDSEPAVANAASMVHIDTDVGAYGLDGILDLVGKNLVDPQSAPFDRDEIYDRLAAQKRRFIFLNTWRPLVPVRSRPLALWATRYKEANGVFPKMRPCLDASRWYVFPEMEPSECLIFKQYDRRLDQACDFWHTSLDIQSKVDGPHVPRRSFDMKAMVVLKETVSPEEDRLAASTEPDLTLDESGNFCAEQTRRRQKVNLKINGE